MFISVFPINRHRLGAVTPPYTVETGWGGLGPYPYTFTSMPGGRSTCPTPCGFTKN